jgi:3-oxoacyl-[acyl-carrier-protein] synthase II
MHHHRASSHADPIVTGFGAVTSTGATADTFWQSVLAGRSGARPVRSFATGLLPNTVACEIADDTIDSAAWRRAAGEPRASRLAATAAIEALSRARLDPRDVDALVVGTTMADLPSIEAALPCRGGAPTPGGVLDEPFDARVVRLIGARCPSLTVATSCSAGNVAISRAVDLIRAGRVRRVLAGGADAFSRLAFIGFSRLRAMAPDRCTPFALGRKGMLLGEGSGFLVVEARASAEARHACAYAAVAGYGLSCDAYHVTAPRPNGEGAAAAIRAALRDAGAAPEDVDYVSAHGTGTVHNDLAEAAACRSVFGARQPFISSLKALIGHTLGAASALEAVACVQSLRDQRLIPAWHVDTPDPLCGVALPAPDQSPPRPLEVLLSNAFAFGGNNSCLVLRAAR